MLRVGSEQHLIFSFSMSVGFVSNKREHVMGFLSNLLGRKSEKSRRKISSGRMSRHLRSSHLGVEPLEERALLSVCVWDGGGANAYWKTAANWVGDVAPVAGDSLCFAGSVRTTTSNNFTAGTTFGSIEFGASNFTLNGNSITLTGGITVDSTVTDSILSINVALGASTTINVIGTDLSIADVISGNYGLTKTGTGSLTLGDTNTYSGGTTISAGTVILANSTSPLGSGSITLNGGELDLNARSITINSLSGSGGSITDNTTSTATTTLTVNQTANGTFSGYIDDGYDGRRLKLVKQGNATLTLNGASSYSGGTTLTAGTLKAGNSYAIGDANWDSGSYGDLIVNGGTLDLNGHDVYAGPLSSTLATGTITNTSDGTTGTLLLYQDATKTFTGTIQDYQSGGVHGRVGIDYYGVNYDETYCYTLTLTPSSGANNYSGGTTIEYGTIKLGNNSAMTGSGFVAMVDNYMECELNLNGRSISIGSLSADGEGCTIINRASGTLATLTVNQTSDEYFTGVMKDGTGDLALVLDGDSTLTLDGTIGNAYTGGTTINGGTLDIYDNTALGNCPVTVNGGTLLLDGVTLSHTINSLSLYDGSVDLSYSDVTITSLTVHGGLFDFDGATARVGTLTQSNGTVDLNYADTTISTLAVNGGTFDFDVATATVGTLTQSSGTVNLDYAGVTITGLTVNGGTCDFNGSTATVGTLTQSNGTVDLNFADVTITGLTVNGGTFNLNGSDLTVQSLNGSAAGVVTDGDYGNILTVNQATGTTSTYYGSIGGSLGVVKTGSGTLVLAGANTNTGGVTVNSGTLQTSGANKLADAGPVTVDGGTLYLGGADTVGDVTLYSGSITGSTTLTGASYWVESGTISSTIVLAGDGYLVKANAGTTFSLTGSHTYTGGTEIYQGTLQLSGNNLYDSGPVLVDGGTLNLAGTETVGAVTMTSGSITGSTLTGSSYAVESGAISAPLAGTGGLTKTTAGTVVLSGANTFTGNTLISGGTLEVNGTLSSSSTATVTVNGGTLAGTGTINRAVSVASGTLSPGSNGGVNVGTLTVGYAGGSGVTMASGTSLLVDIDGNTSGTYDKLVVNGSVSLDSSTLSPDGAYAPSAGSSLTIIDNDSTDAVTGTFSNGASVTVGGVSMTIDYAGGTGNDVVLSRAPLQAAAMGDGADAADLLNDSEMATIVDEAILRWKLNGVDQASLARLRDIRFVVADLNGCDLGLYGGNTIVLDRDAAGWGWFVDKTTGLDEEFLDGGKAIDPNAVDRIDLLSVVEHELGHALGYNDINARADVMGDTLSAGARRTWHSYNDLALMASLSDSWDNEI
jgi:autotransporter-associated beta strand protein